jgi:hypothetical protein
MAAYKMFLHLFILVIDYVPHHTIKHLTITRVFYATFEGDIHQNWQIFDISKANPVKQEQK